MEDKNPVLVQLEKMNGLLGAVVKRLEKTEAKVNSMEEKIASTSPAALIKSRSVPQVIRVCCWLIYKKCVQWI